MKKLIVLYLFLTACEAEHTIEPQLENKFENNILYELNQTKVEVVEDTLFNNGFKVTPTDAQEVRDGGGFENTYVDTFDFGQNSPPPVWQLAQWNSNYNLAGAQPVNGIGGSVEYSNTERKIALYPDRSIYLEVKGSEYYDHPRQQGEIWPAFLISQKYDDLGPVIGQSDRLDFSMQSRVISVENKMLPEEYNPSMHTAHTPFFLMVKNRNSASADYNQRIWFGIRSYDFRHPTLATTEKVSWDIGTNTYIYQVPPRAVWGNISFHDQQWHTGQADLKPLILRALKVMQAENLFLNTNPDDMVVTSMNFGWEVPGTFDVAVRVKNINLDAVSYGQPYVNTDNFDRADTNWATSATSPNPIGNNWQILRGQWRISNTGNGLAEGTRASSENYASNIIMAQPESFGLFEVSAKVKVNATVNTTLAGLAFNIQDEDNYYAFRLGGGGLLQMIRVVNGSVSALHSTTTQLQGNTFYQLRVSADAAYMFNWEVREASTGAILLEGSAEDDEFRFLSGRVGLYANSNHGHFDSFDFQSH